jgi:CRP/FNR family transcriptional regulator
LEPDKFDLPTHLNRELKMHNVELISEHRRKAPPAHSYENDTELFHKGDILYRMGDKVKGIYLINVGAIKLYRVTECGEQQILGFYMPGDIIGLDSISNRTSQSIAEALDTTSVSLIPFNTLLEEKEQLDGQELLRRMSRTLNRDNDLIMMLSQRTAERRLAWFLVEFSDDLTSRGLSPTELTLPMSRTDMSIFLGLALETVCRELTKFCDSGLIKKGRRKINLLNINALRQLANGEEEHETSTFAFTNHAMAH